MKPEQQEGALLDCPFCGKEAYICPDDSYGGCYVGCGPCEMVFGGSKDDQPAIIARWNTRSPHPAKPQPDHFAGGSNALPAGPGVVAPEDDPVVGHKTFRDGLTGFRHEPLHESEANAILDRADAEDKRRKEKMPDERSAINAMFDAYIRLKQLGWNDAIYCPKDGSTFNVLEAGSTGIHVAHYQGEWPSGCWWVRDEEYGDLSPSRPVLYKAVTPGTPHSAHASSAAFPEGRVSHVLVPREPTEERKLTKPAQIGNGIFHAGVPERFVIERAQREYEYQNTPEREAARIANFRKFVERSGND